MIPETPVIDGREEEEVQLGARQADLQTLPTLYFEDAEGVKALSRWRMETEAEREEFLRTGSIYVAQITGGAAPRPILPTVFAPDVPPKRPAEPDPQPADPQPAGLLYEFRVVRLDRETGRPCGAAESGARLFVDMPSLCAAFPPGGPDSTDFLEVIDRQAESFARVVANAYGADVYFRPFGAASWGRVAGRLESFGPSTARAPLAASPGLPRVDGCALDSASIGYDEARDALNMVRRTFGPPYRLLGMSRADAPEVIVAFGEGLTVTEFGGVAAAVAGFRSALKPTADFCLLVAADSHGDDFRRGTFLLDLRLFDKARSN